MKVAQLIISSIRRQWRPLAVLTVLASLGVWLLVFGQTFTAVRRDLSIGDLRKQSAGSEVRVSGVVTFADPRSGDLVFQDKSAALRVSLSMLSTLPNVGDRISLHARVENEYEGLLSRNSLRLADVEAETVGRSRLPAAEPTDMEELFRNSDSLSARRIEIAGSVRVATRRGDRLELEIGHGGWAVPVVVLDAAKIDEHALLYSSVRAQGVVSFVLDKRLSHLDPQLWVASPADLKVVGPSQIQVTAVPSIRALITDPHWLEDGNRVRVQGTVIQSQPEGRLIIENGGVVMPVESPQARGFAAGESVVVTGWLARPLYTTILRRAEVARVNGPIPDQRQAPDPALPVMTSVAQIRKLGNEGARKAYPVQLTAILTAIHPLKSWYYAQSEGVGIYVDATDQDVSQLRPGQKVLLEGLTSAGGFAPIICHPKLTVLGENALPPAMTVDPELAPSGAYIGTWVEMEGVVHPIESTNGDLTFKLMTQLGAIPVALIHNRAQLDELVDARVRVRGALASSFTKEGVLLGYRLMVDSLDYVSVVRPAPTSPAAIQHRAIADLLRYSPPGQGGFRVRLRGAVTLRQGNDLYVEDETGGTRAQILGSKAGLGDLVEVVGYPNPSEKGPFLADAVVTNLRQKAQVTPTVLSSGEVLEGHADNKLVTIEARLLSQAPGYLQQKLMLQSGETSFNAELDSPVQLPELREGSVVRVTGVAIVQRERILYLQSHLVPVSFRIQLRSTSDVQVVRLTPWWNLRHAWPVLAALSLSICLAMVWVMVLRRRVQAQTTELSAQQTFLRQVIDLCPNFIFVKDPQGRITLANRAIADLFQHSAAEMIGKTVVELGLDPALAESHLADDRDVLSGKVESTSREDVRKASEGAQVWFHTQKRALLDAQGRRTHVLGVSNDISMHKNAEHTLLQAREAAEAANRAKSEFLANMSHEIRTPLNGIIGMSDLCLGTTLSGEQREYLETVKISADGLLNLINDILDFSKIEAGKLTLDNTDLDLREMLGSALKIVSFRALEKGLDLSCEVAPDLPRWFHGDGNRLRQIVLNLIGNAIKFTAIGQVSVSARLISRQDNLCTLQVTVADTGIGIPANRQAAIFSPFEQADASTTRRYGGTGLGLSISRRLVEMMNGRMWLESTPNQGSRFHFTVSLEAIEKHQPQTVAANTPERCAAEIGTALNILVAEDNAVNQKLITRLLTKRGHQVTVTGDGNAVVAEFERGHFDLVLMDIQMPELDGFQATAEIRRRQGHAAGRVPIVALTAHAMSGDRERCLAAGMDSYLTKPISPADLDEILNRYGRRAAAPADPVSVRKAAAT